MKYCRTRNPPGSNHAAAHQEGIRARAAGEAGGLEIQEQDVAACRPGVRCPRRDGRLLTAGALTSPRGACKDGETGCVMVHMACAVADAEQTVQMLVVVHTLDDDAGSRLTCRGPIRQAHAQPRARDAGRPSAGSRPP